MTDGAVARDPVCGMTLKSSAGDIARDYGGQTYYFCSAGCREQFDREPARYVGATLTSERARFRVLGLSCAGEAAGLEHRLRRVADLESVTINPLTETAYVVFDPSRVNLDVVKSEVARWGYRVQ